jgi:predicted nucleic acid-binding protein
MIVLDTNVFSALMLPTPEPIVVEWLDRQVPGVVCASAVTVYEIRTGIDLLPEGRKRLALDEAFDRALTEKLQNRVLPFDRVAADEAGRLLAARKRQGFTDEFRDTQIAGIVLARRATLATRNVRHFRSLGAMVVNPWEPD